MGLHVAITRQLSGLAVRLPRLALGVATAALLAIVAGACGSSATPPTTTTTTLPPLPPQIYAYVTMIGAGANIGNGHSVIPVNVSVGGSGPGGAIRVGAWPDAIAITPDGTRAYVTNYNSDSVTPINLRTGTVLPSITLSANAGPAGIAIAPDGKTAYVADAGAGGTLGNTITPIDLKSDQPLPPITVGPGPEAIAITPDGARAYVADTGAFVQGQPGSIGSTVTPVDLSTHKALPPVPVGNAPIAVAITPDGSTALVANANSGSISPIDVASDTAGSPISVQGGPNSIAISPTEPTRAWIADGTSDSSTTGNVTLIDLTTDTAGSPIEVGKDPQSVAISPDGTTAWVVCYDSQTLVPLSTKTLRPGAAIRLAGGPYAIALTERSASSLAPAPSPAKGTSGSKNKEKG
ncbi:MAG: YncE family protein [Acidimicrobiales bacterium]|jgi:YVTN family beta-propeller protein